MNAEVTKRRLPHVFGAFVWFVLLWCLWERWRYVVPGQWLGESDMFPLEFAVALALLVFGCAALAFWRKPWWVALIIATFLLHFPRGQELELRRARIELPRYREALQQGKRYGDQHAAVHQGRILTYWRWHSFGIDNAIGVAYDPAQRLEGELQTPLFKSVAHGVLWSVEPLAPGWYLVRHS